MPELKLTKNELRTQQIKLSQLEKYLPTLQLKKAMLQAEVMQARHEINELELRFSDAYHAAEQLSPLLSDTVSFNPDEMVSITEIKKRWENIAGVEVPYFDGITFKDYAYNLLDTPPWLDSMISQLRAAAASKAAVEIAREKKAALEKELREVSIRVNLFEKILIPRSKKNIKKIKDFLGEMRLAAVAQAKMAKAKIQANKRLREALGGSHAY